MLIVVSQMSVGSKPINNIKKLDYLRKENFMIKKFIKATLLAVLLIASVMFPGATSTEAIDMAERDNGDNSIDIIIEKSNDGVRASKVPDLGDDQAFPFIPGFGNDSGKD